MKTLIFFFIRFLFLSLFMISIYGCGSENNAAKFMAQETETKDLIASSKETVGTKIIEKKEAIESIEKEMANLTNAGKINVALDKLDDREQLSLELVDLEASAEKLTALEDKLTGLKDDFKEELFSNEEYKEALDQLKNAAENFKE